MKRQKKMTPRAVAANRSNGQLSRGPQSAAGKARSSRNALQTGFFCRQLHVAEEERELYRRLKVGIDKQLRPTTTLQRIHADLVVDAAWRCRQASQLDARYLNDRLSHSSPEDLPAPPKLASLQWYGANPRAMRQAISLIDVLIPEVRSGGHIPEHYVENVKQAFGETFYTSLTEWEMSGLDRLWLVENMVYKAELFDLDYKRVVEQAKRETDGGPSTKPNDDAKPEHLPWKIVKDPLEHAQMLVKLLEEKKQQLLDLQSILKHLDGNIGGRQSIEPPSRYVGWAVRQLEHAWASYLRLVANGL